MFPVSQSVGLVAAFRSISCVVLKACFFYSFKQVHSLIIWMNSSVFTIDIWCHAYQNRKWPVVRRRLFTIYSSPYHSIGLIITHIQLRNGLSGALLLATMFLSLKNSRKSIPLYSSLQLHRHKRNMLKLKKKHPTNPESSLVKQLLTNKAWLSKKNPNPY